MDTVVVGVALTLALAFVVNFAPGAMPPAWIVIAVLVAQFDLPVVPIAVAAVCVGGLGRATLARAATVTRRLSPPGQERELERLGALLHRHPREVLATSFLYSVALPTNVLFIAAGLAGAQLRWLVLGYWGARVPIDSALVVAANAVSGDALVDVYRTPVGVALQLAGLATLVLLVRTPWPQWVARIATRHLGPDGQA